MIENDTAVDSLRLPRLDSGVDESRRRDYGICGGGSASIGAGLGCSTFAVPDCAALSGGFSTTSTRRAGTRTALMSATFV